MVAAHSARTSRGRLAAGEPAAVQLILDGRRSNAAQIVAGYASAIVDRYDRELPPTRRRRRRQHGRAARSGSTRTWRPPGTPCPALVAILTTLMGLVVTALVGGPRARAGHVRAVAGLAASAARDHHRQDRAGAVRSAWPRARSWSWSACSSSACRSTARCVLLYLAHGRLSAGGDRRRAVHLVAGQDPAAGDPGRVRVHGAGDPAVGLCQPDRKHARLAADA